MKTLKNILYLIAMFAVIFIAIGVPTMLIQFSIAAIGINIAEDTLYEVSGCGGIAAAAVLCAVYVKKKHSSKIPKTDNFNVGNALIFMLFTVCFCKITVEEITAGLLCGIYPVEVFSSRHTYLLDYIFAILFAPIFEELLFRYGIFNLLKNRFSETAAMLLSAVAFAFSHGYQIQGFVSCFAVAIVLTMIYRKTHDIRYCILCHCGCNIFATVINISVDSGAELFGMPFLFDKNGYNLFHPVIIIPAVSFCIVYFLKNRKTEKNNV